MQLNYQVDPLKQLENAMFNKKFLESQLIPLSESNAQLKQSIHALIFYMEERRTDFASLLSHFQDTNPEQLIIQIGDMITIYETLKQEILKSNEVTRDKNAKISELEMEIVQLKEELNQEEQSNQEQVREFESQVKFQQQQIEHQYQEMEQLKSLKNEEINEYQKLIESVERNHQEVVQQIKHDYEQVIEQIKLNDDDYDKKLNQVKFEYQIQRDKIEAQHMQELKRLTHDINDKIQKAELKNKQLLNEVQILRSDLQQSNQLSNGQQKSIRKLQKQIDNLTNVISQLKQELTAQKQKKEEQFQQIEYYKEDLIKVTRNYQSFQCKFERSKEQIAEMEQKNQEYSSQQDETMKQLKQELNEKIEQVLQLEVQVLKQQKEYYKQYQIQKNKYEKLIKGGQNVIQEQEYQLVDVDTQFDSYEFKQVLEEYERMIAQQDQEIKKLNGQINKQDRQIVAIKQQMKQSYDSQVHKIMTDCKQQIKKNDQQFKSQIEQLLQVKQSEINYMIDEFENKKLSIKQQYNQEFEQYNQQIEELKNENSQLNTTITTLEDHILKQQMDIYQLQKKHDMAIKDILEQNEKTMDSIKYQHHLFVDQLREDNDQLQSKIDELTKIKQNDNKNLFDYKKKIDQMVIQIRNLNDEKKALDQQIQNKEEQIDQQNGQATKANELIRYLQIELENTKQIYNIFKSSNSNIGQVRFATSTTTTDESVPIKNELKKMLAIKLKDQTQLIKQKRQQGRRIYLKTQYTSQSIDRSHYQRTSPKHSSIQEFRF